MKINGNAIRPGNIIEHKGRLMRAVKLQQVKPGKGGAFAQVELKDIRDGTKMNERFRSDETVERVRLDQVEYQFLFADGEMLTFMNNDTFDQIELNSELVGEPLPFLQENMHCKMKKETTKNQHQTICIKGWLENLRGLRESILIIWFLKKFINYLKTLNT